MIDLTRSTDEDEVAVAAIVDAVAQWMPQADRITMHMDLIACHTHGCQLDLAKMITANRSDLIHDIVGINRHLDRETGELRDCFLPRGARSEERDQRATDAAHGGRMMNLYYHQTGGGAEYLTDAYIETADGHREGVFEGARYIVRIDGDIRTDAELRTRRLIQLLIV